DINKIIDCFYNRLINKYSNTKNVGSLVHELIENRIKSLDNDTAILVKEEFEKSFFKFSQAFKTLILNIINNTIELTKKDTIQFKLNFKEQNKIFPLKDNTSILVTKIQYTIKQALQNIQYTDEIKYNNYTNIIENNLLYIWVQALLKGSRKNIYKSFFYLLDYHTLEKINSKEVISDLYYSIIAGYKFYTVHTNQNKFETIVMIVVSFLDGINAQDEKRYENIKNLCTANYDTGKDCQIMDRRTFDKYYESFKSIENLVI
ncbi:hypothetical protein OAR97_02500, partial [Arcobacteraceae bacterium]|nr:hypothetical protein [Arcobacteraceae bacterium]